MNLVEELSALVTPEDDPTNTPNPVWSLFLVYKFVKKGKDLQAVKNDKRWDNLNSGGQLRTLARILAIGYEGDLKKAAKAVLEIGEFYERLGITWDASTVFKRLTDWEEGRLGRS